MHRFTREELYELVWIEAKTKLAKRLGISDVGLAKACIKANIPIPDRGYWAKKEAGKATIRPSLPSRGLGHREDVVIGSRYYEREVTSDTELMAAEPVAPAPFAETLEDVRKRAEAMVAKVRVPKTLSRVYPAIGKLLEQDERRREKFRLHGYSWDAPVFETPFEKRRLKILNSIFLTLADCGSSLSVRGDHGRELHAMVGDSGFSFTLDDVAAKPSAAHMPPRPSDAKARMRLQVERSWPLEGVTIQWEDTVAARLEDQLQEITAGLLVVGECAYRDWRARNHEWDLRRRSDLLEKARREKAEAERKEAERLRKIERDRRDGLLAEVVGWRQAAEIRAYVEDVLGQSTAASHNPPQEVQLWAIWALAEADRIDPLKCQHSVPIDAPNKEVSRRSTSDDD